MRADGTTLVVVEDAVWLVREACLRVRSLGERRLFSLFLSGAVLATNGAVAEAVIEARCYGVRMVPLLPSSRDTAEAVTIAAEAVGARAVIMGGAERRGPLARLRVRRTLHELRRRLGGRTLILHA